jgi:uncharacterized LabA/DUF88 family protein
VFFGVSLCTILIPLIMFHGNSVIAEEWRFLSMVIIFSMQRAFIISTLITTNLLRVLLGDGRLLRAFFYTGVDVGAERQQGFLLWMRRNGFRVIQKELKTFYDGTRKANLDVEIAVDMLSLAGRYDTAVLVSGDEDFVYAVNAVAYKGCRVEIAGFRSNTAPKLIDVSDYFIDLGEIADKVRKEISHGALR